mgnify:CR=1 FL=1
MASAGWIQCAQPSHQGEDQCGQANLCPQACFQCSGRGGRIAFLQCALKGRGINVHADFARVNAPPARSFTVTSRQASLPLQFTNQLPRPVRVRVRFVSTRLTVRGGSVQTLTLRPGVTPVRLPVTVRTSGQFRLVITVSTPDGGVNLHQSVMSIRSTAFSGVGLVLSIAAAAFLVVWWIRTLRRERQERQRGGKHRRPRRGQRSEGSGG